MTKSIQILLSIALILCTPLLGAQDPVQGKTGSSLRAGVCKMDITPPLTVPLGGYSSRTGPASGIRDSLNTVVIVFDDGESRAAMVTLDLIQVKQNEGKLLYQAIEEETGIIESNVIINASHTHGSPWLETDTDYRDEVVRTVARAVKKASQNLEPVSLGYDEGAVRFNVSRRKITEQGQCINTLNPAGLTDHRVKVLRVDRTTCTDIPEAILFHLPCHPNVLRWKNTEISADFPGEAKSFIEKNFDKGTTALFLQGSSGDIRANLPEEGKGPDEPSFGRNGDENDMKWCGWSLGAAAVKSAVWLGVRDQIKQRQPDNTLRAASGIVEVSAKKNNDDVVWPREQVINGKVQLAVKMISIGDICFVALPGEPVIQYGFLIEEQMLLLGFKHVFVMGYSDGDAGYIPVKNMFEKGGYEVKASALLPSCEEEIMDGITKLAAELVHQKN